MTNRILYMSEESKALPSGTYLGLSHGRDTVDEDMEDWGYPGPMIGPITGFHITYDATVRIGFESLDAARKFFPDAKDPWVDIIYVEDMFFYEGKYYGDWTIFQHTDRTADTITQLQQQVADLTAERVAIAKAALEAAATGCWPKLKIWSEDEQQEMTLAFNRAQERHGWYETLMAVGAVMCKRNAATILAIDPATIVASVEGKS